MKDQELLEKNKINMAKDKTLKAKALNQKVANTKIKTDNKQQCL